LTPGFSTYEHTDMKPVRGASKREYGAATAEEKLAAVRKLASLKLPVSTVRRMKTESVPSTEDLAP
jgi:hypothetical protein